jgi:catechol 2,3-dioxygenase-like lactoylglutathione lyase family enzyme
MSRDLMPAATTTRKERNVDWSLEVVSVPVSDIDRAKAFYADQLGFIIDYDSEYSDEYRVVQLTPIGSGCSITIGTGAWASKAGSSPELTRMPPGSLRGIQLVVPDISAARLELLERGMDVSEVHHFEDGGWLKGPGGEWNSFAFFSDPDGNGWVLQESAVRVGASSAPRSPG